MNKLNKIFSGITVIIAFWGLFWLLNGLDKFYNGTNQPNLVVTEGVIMDPDSRLVVENDGMGSFVILSQELSPVSLDGIKSGVVGIDGGISSINTVNALLVSEILPARSMA